jgi:hypothetical protein
LFFLAIDCTGCFHSLCAFSAFWRRIDSKKSEPDSVFFSLATYSACSIWIFHFGFEFLCESFFSLSNDFFSGLSKDFFFFCPDECEAKLKISLAVATGCSGSAVQKYSSKFTFSFSGFAVSFFVVSVLQNHIPERNPPPPNQPNSQALRTFHSDLSCCFLSAMHNFS